MHTLLVTGLHGRKCRFGMFRKTDSAWGTLRSAVWSAWFAFLLNYVYMYICSVTCIHIMKSVANIALKTCCREKNSMPQDMWELQNYAWSEAYEGWGYHSGSRPPTCTACPTPRGCKHRM